MKYEYLFVLREIVAKLKDCHKTNINSKTIVDTLILLTSTGSFVMLKFQQQMIKVTIHAAKKSQSTESKRPVRTC